AAGGEEPAGDLATDVGVDLESGTITIGLLSDLTGPFGPLVSAIVAGMEAYWADVNANGGINGLTVELEVRDTVYEIPAHVQFYEELKTQVAAFGHSTGSPHTVAINPQLQADGILAIPLTWYSGWTDPAINANLMHHGVPYCIEAMNLLGYIGEERGGSTIAIASLPGDYGLDSAAGAAIAAEELGLEVVYDGTGQLNPADPSTLTAVANGISESNPEIVFVTATPSVFFTVYDQATEGGLEATWTGAGPSWSPAHVGPDVDAQDRDGLIRDFVGNVYTDVWAGESEGAQRVTELMGDAPPTDYYNEGVVEATILHEALLRAYENGDMTQQGILDAAKSSESVTFDGLAPDESYTGEPNDQLQRAGNIFVPNTERATGSEVVAANYTSDLAANYDFTEACYTLE
ncbi:MAG: ABC transporter substrate-binding protein, partial [Acidimicrobiia bacterium]|nr:ABC transporter substrate-binding protein [Acidimicrobiia bacterium]